MKGKKFLSLIVSAAMAASCMSGLALTASADDGEYTVSIGTITGGSEGDVMLINPNATAQPTDVPTEAPTATTAPTGVTPITESYTFIADNFTNAGTTAIDAGTYLDNARVYSEKGNSVATNKQKSTINGTEYYNSLRLKGTQNYLEFQVGIDASVTVYSQVHASRTIVAGTTAGGKDLGNGEANSGEFTFTVSAGTKVYITGVNVSDLTTAGDLFIAGFTVTPTADMGSSEVEAADSEVLVSSMTAKAGDIITVKAEDKIMKDVVISTDNGAEVTAVEDKAGYYTFTMPAADTTVNAEYVDNSSKLPEDEIWRADDAAFDDAISVTSATTVNGLTVYPSWTSAAKTATYTHIDGTEYTYSRAWQGGTGSTTTRALSFTPKMACTVTAVFDGNGGAGRNMYIVQHGETLATGTSISTGTVAVSADIEDPSKGDVYIYGGGSNKNLYAVMVEYYDPSVVVSRTVSGNISYSGTIGLEGKTIVFTNSETGEAFEVPYSETYSVSLPQRATYNVTVKGNESTICATLDTNSVYVAKEDKEFNIDLVDIVDTELTGEIVSHGLDMTGVTVTFTAQDDASITKTATVTAIGSDKEIPEAEYALSVVLTPNHVYDITTSAIDGYTMSNLSKTYTMVAGDTEPFKNLLFTKDTEAVPFKDTITVGADKEYQTVNDAVKAIGAMTDRPNGEDGRVSVVIDPGTYCEQVIVNQKYVTFKAADENNKPVLTWYYGINYTYYSVDGGYYSEAKYVERTTKEQPTRWGCTVRVTASNFNAENIIFENSFNCRVVEEEIADGVEPAENTSMLDRTVSGFDAMAKDNVTERAAAFAGDAMYYECYKCEFVSSQDTLYTGYTGYFKECYIEGATDYIFGGNSIVFEDCTLAWHGYSDKVVGGYITACQTSDVPSGSVNQNSNGYLLKNCTVTTSKNYPNNKFDAGSWGRNWGGSKCQVVYDGITITGIGTPGAWVKMGGELSESVLYVTNVTDQNGDAVDVSGTVFNPNGTMETNGYTEMAETDYFGTWIPPHYTGAIEEPTETTALWDFQNVEPSSLSGMSIQGTTGTVASTVDGISLEVDATSGKLAQRTSDAQFNEGTIIKVPVSKDSVVTVVSYPGYHNYTVAGVAADADTVEYTATEEGYVEIVATGSAYLYSIKVVTPNAESEATEEPTATAPAATEEATATAPAATEEATATAPATTEEPTATAPAATEEPTATAPAATEDASATEEATQDPSAAEVSCVKITATYGEGGALENVTTENVTVPLSEAVTSTNGNVKTMYWESLESMKPVSEDSVPTQKPSGDETVSGVTPEKTITVGSGVKLNANDFEAGSYQTTIEKDGFYIGADSSVDENGKSTGEITVDSAGSSGATVNGTKYLLRIKTGGTGYPETGVRCFYFTVDSDCTIEMDATSSSGSADRDVVVLHGGSEEHITVGAKAGYTVSGIKAGETVVIYSAEGGLNVYGIALTPVSGSDDNGNDDNQTAATVTWAVSEDSIGLTAGAELMQGLTLVSDNSSTSKKYVTGASDGKWVDGVLTGAALKYEATANGTLTVSIVDLGNADQIKTAVITDASGTTIVSHTTEGLAKESFDLTTEVTAGNTYYIYGQGTKARFAAASFTPAQ